MYSLEFERKMSAYIRLNLKGILFEFEWGMYHESSLSAWAAQTIVSSKDKSLLRSHTEEVSKLHRSDLNLTPTLSERLASLMCLPSLGPLP